MEMLAVRMDLQRPAQNGADEKNVKEIFHLASRFENDEN